MKRDLAGWTRTTLKKCFLFPWVLLLPLQEVMCVEEECTSCYCLMDSNSCHLLLDRPGSYALVGEPLTQATAKRLKLAAFGSAQAHSALYSLRVYCVDDTPHAFQVSRWPAQPMQQVTLLDFVHFFNHNESHIFQQINCRFFF